MRKLILPALKVLTVAVLGGVLVYAIARVLPAQQTGQTSIGPVEVPVDVDTASLRGPVQPIFYRHDVHAGQYEMDCLYCHFAAEVSQSPGLPTMSSCMGCHLIAGSANSEVQKLREAAAADTVIQWVEVHKLPPFVRFPHMRHVMSDTEMECQDCHGPIEEMPQVYQFASLKMGWCLDCHLEEEATTDCTACHY
jgi:hypothetical protein